MKGKLGIEVVKETKMFRSKTTRIEEGHREIEEGKRIEEEIEIATMTIDIPTMLMIDGVIMEMKLFLGDVKTENSSARPFYVFYKNHIVLQTCLSHFSYQSSN